MTTLKYITTSEFTEALGLQGKVPNWDIGNSAVNEAVGTGDESTLTFYLDQKNIINNTYTLYADGEAMTDVTHYSLELSTGVITLTEAGKTLLSTNDLTAKYKFINVGMSDEYLTAVLKRAERQVDKKCNSVFIDTSGDNPSYLLETEIQYSESYFQDRIIVKKKPLIDIKTTLDGAVDISQVTIDLASGTGSDYPSTGSIIVGSEVMTYTGITTDQLTGVTRGAMGTTAATHDDGDDVHTTILFKSNTPEGTAVSWTVQPWDSSMFADDTGLIYSFNDSDPSFLSANDVASRIKIIYYYGYNEVPEDITRLNLILGKRQLMSDTIGKAIIVGRDEFKPEMFNADMMEMQSIINSYIVLPMGNT